MSQDQFRAALDAFRAKLQTDVEQQYAALEAERAEAVATAQRQAGEDAEKRWASRVETLQGEWTARLRADLAAAAEESERRLEELRERLRLESDARTAESLASARAEIEAGTRRAVAEAEGERSRVQDELDAERARAAALNIERDRLREELDAQKTEEQAALDAERARTAELIAERDRLRRELDSHSVTVRAAVDDERMRASELAAERDRLREELNSQKVSAHAALESERRRADGLDRALEEAQAALAAERAEAARSEIAVQPGPAPAEITDARAAERESQLATIERLLDATTTMSNAGTVTAVLGALVEGAAETAPRAALFIVNGRVLQGWRARGFSNPQELSVALRPDDAGVLAQAMKTGKAVPADASSAPRFAALPQDRAGIALPILVGGRAVAVLYADDHGIDTPEAPASWPEAVEILSQHAGACVAHLTAVRTAQAVRRTGQPSPSRAPSSPRSEESQSLSDEENGARRYARLLVSEIKLYNETAVRVGREKRDLLSRLRPEIDRARRLYEERVSPSIGGRGVYFQQELVQTLADGDPALLGSSV